MKIILNSPIYSAGLFCLTLIKFSKLSLIVLMKVSFFPKHTFIMLSTLSLKSGIMDKRHTYEPAHDKTYIKTCETQQPDQSICWLHVPSTALGYPKSDKQEPLPYWVDVEVDLSLCWSHRSYCRFCHSLTHIIMNMWTVYNSLTLVLLNQDIPCLCKQCRSRSVGFSEANWSESAPFVIMWIQINNLDQVIWLAEKLEMGMAP